MDTRIFHIFVNDFIIRYFTVKKMCYMDYKNKDLILVMNGIFLLIKVIKLINIWGILFFVLKINYILNNYFNIKKFYWIK